MKSSYQENKNGTVSVTGRVRTWRGEDATAGESGSFFSTHVVGPRGYDGYLHSLDTSPAGQRCRVGGSSSGSGAERYSTYVGQYRVVRVGARRTILAPV